MLAGEGLGGVFQALLAVIGVDGGSTYHSSPFYCDCLIGPFCSALLRIWHRNRLSRIPILWMITYLRLSDTRYFIYAGAVIISSPLITMSHRQKSIS